MSARAMAAAAGAGIASGIVLHFVRGFPWSLAAVAGLAVAVLVGAAWRSAGDLARIWRGDHR